MIPALRLLLAVAPASVLLAASSPIAWQPWIRIPGVFDVAGPLTGGSLVVNTGRLYLVMPSGPSVPYPQPASGYASPPGVEAYLDVSSGAHVADANCAFRRDDIFVIRPSAPVGVTRVDANGHSSNFADIGGIDSLNGIIFDSVGAFDHRLLVTGPLKGRTVVIALDCNGGSQRISDSAPPLEGGLAVAPRTFGAFAGDLIGSDEVNGSVWAISSTGQVSRVIQSTIRHGGDVGVESEGFVPSGFFPDGVAYLADRSTPGNAHPGNDSLLRLKASQLNAAGVQEGDLLIAAEGGGVTIDVRCGLGCSETTVVPIETSAHIEGHLLLVPGQRVPRLAATLGDRGASVNSLLLIPVAILLAAVAVFGAKAVRKWLPWVRR